VAQASSRIPGTPTSSRRLKVSLIWLSASVLVQVMIVTAWPLTTACVPAARSSPRSAGSTPVCRIGEVAPAGSV
jgi:hypothetical protein